MRHALKFGQSTSPLAPAGGRGAALGRLQLFPPGYLLIRVSMRTNVYVDGFNLYYGCLRNTPFRWLDLSRLSALLLPKHDIHRIRYFTALVSARPADPTQPARQHDYLRALRTIPNLSIHYGEFLTHPVRMPLVTPTGIAPSYVTVMKTEEKGSDVNLATHLLYDAFLSEYDAAVVISNDSDLIEPIRIVRREFYKVVGILNPQKGPSRALLPEVSFLKQIRPGALVRSQFPQTLRDEHGRFEKPAVW
jgi:uncharacterized LabA/DUF88 family protein